MSTPPVETRRWRDQIRQNLPSLANLIDEMPEPPKWGEPDDEAPEVTITLKGGRLSIAISAPVDLSALEMK